MRSSYERSRFRVIYFIMAFLFLVIVMIWTLNVWGKFTRRTVELIGIVVVFTFGIYLICYRRLNKVYEEIENVSVLMTDVIEKDEEPPSEEYREGTIGILYSNFYKMLHVLKQSRNREMEEKIFLRDIISDISHQLKTPLASLNVFVDLLQEDKVKEPEKRKQILTETANQLSRMEWMVLSMLKLARIEAGAIQFERRDNQLRPLLMQAAEGVQFLVQERRQTLQLDCMENISLVCDGDWLVEAIINLLKNASDYSGDGKPIWIEAEQTAVYTRISIKDEGPGIPEKEIPNIFKRFYRVHQEVNPNSVGIGLSLTKSIVEGMGGSIHVKSEEGSYTWFVLTFVH
ncbi:MAG: HAMP domain-containing histidine kinase [Lachnospiraceae bacterium]|nr:HAMP domain-containing histidine kinase [Lachnospiraceae bacterium]MDE6625428.1 HAMP domain-containing histidine kinase [Lachnospiraceae bacterium]